MHLRENEKIMKVVRRHLTPFIISILKPIMAGALFVGLLLFFDNQLDSDFMIITILVITTFVGFSIAYTMITYRLDRLVITTHRIIWINWKSFFKREEHELAYQDIQDIHTREKGILSYFRIFDYGLFQVETSASKTTIEFEDAPDPEGIKHYVLEYYAKIRGRHNNPPHMLQ